VDFPSVTEEEQLILKIVGEEKLAALNAELAKETKLVTDATTAFRTLGMSQAQYEQIVATQIPKLMDLNGQIKELNVQAKSFSGQGGIQLGYVFDDLVNTSGNWQRHLASISNNMPGLLMSLGVGTGLAGQLSLIYTGFIAVLPVMTKFFDMLTGGSEEARQNLEALKKSAEEAADAFVTLADKATPPEAASQKAIAAKLGGQQGRAMQDAIIAAMQATGTGAPAQAEEDVPLWLRTWAKVDPMRAAGMRALKKPEIDQAAQERIKRDNLAKAQATLGNAIAGKTPAARLEAIQFLQGLQQQVPGAFTEEQNISNLTPRAFEQSQALDRQNKAEARTTELEMKRREKADQDKKAQERTVAQAERDAASASREMDAANKRKAHDDAAILKKDEQERHARQRAMDRQTKIDAKEGPIQAMSGYFAGTDANEAQVRQMSERAVDLMQNYGVPAMFAAQSAYQEMSQKIARMQEQLMGIGDGFNGMKRANNRQLGGQGFSAQSPMPGGG
jgi:hypothetical protein